MLPHLLADQRHRFRIERHRYCLSRFRLVRMDPRQPPHQINLRPLQTGHVRGAQTSRERILNAAAALYVSGVAPSLWDGVALARESIASGAAQRKLDQLVQFTRAFAKAS